MPLDFRKFRKEIENERYSVQETERGHYWVLTPSGGKLIVFAVQHGSSTKKEVHDAYISKVRKAIHLDKGQGH